MQLVMLQQGGRRGPGMVLDDEILDLGAAAKLIPEARLLPASLRALLEMGDTALSLLHRIADRVAERGAHERLRGAGALVARASAQLLAPIPDPAIVLSCGMNYRAHLAEMNTPVPATPTAFTKSVASIIGTGNPIRLPPGHADMVDWEGEFCAVIGKPCHRVGEAEALDYVAGYTLINDVSARDWVAPIFSATGIMGPILAWEHNVLGKQFPTFCPMGPALVTKDAIRDPGKVQLTTRLNGEVMQSANTDDLVFGVARVIAYFSKFYAFRPGDVISTGSPAGVGYGREPKVFMRPGDVIEVEATGIGVLRNPIAA
jgi:2-keto-4-pentenoate hydratase/2-oxohepta-3-ene-1,7-dioic acid hydratase in catechol pathway